MRKRTYILVCSFAWALLATSAAMSQTAVPPAPPTDQPKADAEASVFPFEGEISGTNVYVRSGPGINYYPTTKLNAGDRVLVLGEKFGWYEIAPPPKSFSYIDMSAVDRSAGAKTGKITKDQAYVTAGSELEKRKTSTQIPLAKGATVEILGEADGFYRIVPPRGAKLFVSRQYIESVPERLQTGLLEQYENTGVVSSGRTRVPTAGQPPAKPAPTDAGDVPPAGADEAPGGLAQGGAGEQPLPIDKRLGAAGKPGTAKSDREKPAETDGPLSGRYMALVTILESELQGMLKDPTKEPDFASLKPRYSEIANQKEERVAAQIAEIRIKQLDDLASFRKGREEILAEESELDDFRARLNEERMRLMRERVEKTIAKFDFEGEIRQSYAFAPEKNRYRLVDPVKQTTLAYVDVPLSTGVRMDEMIGRLVGVRAQRQYFSPAARVPIVVASSVVDLSVRPGPLTDEPDPADDENITAGAGKSTERPPARSVAEPPRRVAGDPEKAP